MKFRKYDSTNLLAMIHWRSSMSDLTQAKPRTEGANATALLPTGNLNKNMIKCCVKRICSRDASDFVCLGL